MTHRIHLRFCITASYAAQADIRPQFIAIKKFPELKTYGLTLNMVVHYRELNKDGFVITTFTMSKKK